MQSYKAKFVLIFFSFLLMIAVGYFLIRSKTTTTNFIGLDYVSDVLGIQTQVIEVPRTETFLDFIKNSPGEYSFIIDSNNINLSYNEKKVFYAASLFKIPVAVATVKYLEQNGVYDISNYPNVIQKGDPGTTEESLSSPPSFRGSVATEESAQQVLYVKEQLNYLLKDSNNDSQEYLMNLVGLDLLQQAFIGLGLESNGDFYLNNNATAEQIVKMFKNLQTTTYLLPENRDYLIKLMYETSFDDRISVYLKSSLKYSHKIGNWPDTGTWHDCGVVTGDKQLDICLMSEGVTLDQFMVVSKAFAEYINTL